LEIRDNPSPVEAFYLLAKRNFFEVVLRAVLSRVGFLERGLFANLEQSQAGKVTV
jgi:hypothetical protein